MIIGALALGGALEAAALGAAYVRWRFRRAARPVVGRVVARRSQASGSIRIHAPVVDYEIDGKTHRFTSTTYGTGCPEVGDELALLVSPRDPSRAVLASGAGITTVIVILALLGAVFVFAGIFGEPVPG
jgi:hypothetical protein